MSEREREKKLTQLHLNPTMDFVLSLQWVSRLRVMQVTEKSIVIDLSCSEVLSWWSFFLTSLHVLYLARQQVPIVAELFCKFCKYSTRESLFKQYLFLFYIAGPWTANSPIGPWNNKITENWCGDPNPTHVSQPITISWRSILLSRTWPSFPRS